MVEPDPTYADIAAILRVVPASHWAFACLEASGNLGHLIGTEPGGDQRSWLTHELHSQRVKFKTGAFLAAPRESLGDYASGVTMIFADARTTYGILSLLRTNALGPFTSSEISVLTLALDIMADRLARLCCKPCDASAGLGADWNDARDVPEEVQSAFYVLDQDLHIVLTRAPQQRREVDCLKTGNAERLPPVLEGAVRELVASWRNEPLTQVPGIARPVPFLVLRTQPLTGSTGWFVGVHVDRFRPAHSLTARAARYHISPRELEVLKFLLDGAKLAEIGTALCITTSTVQDHIRSMVDKTESRNRTQLIASVLGW